MLQKELAKRLKARHDTKMDGSGWLEVSSDGNSVFWGDYSPNYEYVKEAFAVRSGLVSKHRLFSEKESADLCRCVDFHTSSAAASSTSHFSLSSSSRL